MEASPTLCAPGHDLGCFACCPPIRPPGYDHVRFESSLRRLFVENTAHVRAGALPTKAMLGYWCPGLGFLEPNGRRVGCLLHPAQNGGQDLRGPTGYQEKCARETCHQARAHAQLPPGHAAGLVGLCRGMDSFAFSSPARNPLMRLLAFGPRVAAAVAGLGPAGLDDLAGLPWLAELEPADGWLLALLAEARGPAVLGDPATSAEVAALDQRLKLAVGPRPPMVDGQPLHQLTDIWEARFWKKTAGRLRVRPAELAAWRGALADLL